MKFALLFIYIFGFAFPSFAQKKGKKAKYHYRTKFATEEEIKQEPQKIMRILKTIAGHYSNKEQADTLNNMLYQRQEMLVLPILEKKRQGETWFYLAWFSEAQYTRPLGEGICRIERYNRDTFLLRAFVFDEPSRVNWQAEDGFDELDLKSILQKESCLGYIVEEEVGKVHWTMPEPCKHGLSDQVQYHQIDFVCDMKKIDAFTGYYNGQQQLLFAYPKELPNTFVKIKPENLK